jgi:hypothetical protein
MKQSIIVQREDNKIFFTLDETDMSFDVSLDKTVPLFEDSIEKKLDLLWEIKFTLKNLKTKIKSSDKYHLENTVSFNFYESEEVEYYKINDVENSPLKLFYEIQRYEYIIQINDYILHELIDDINTYFQT